MLIPYLADTRSRPNKTAHDARETMQMKLQKSHILWNTLRWLLLESQLDGSLPVSERLSKSQKPHCSSSWRCLYLMSKHGNAARGVCELLA